jgi:hypothetical protein
MLSNLKNDYIATRKFLFYNEFFYRLDTSGRHPTGKILFLNDIDGDLGILRNLVDFPYKLNDWHIVDPDVLLVDMQYEIDDLIKSSLEADRKL